MLEFAAPSRGQDRRFSRASVCVVQPNPPAVSETFLRAHVDRLPADVTVAHGYPPIVDGQPVLDSSWSGRVARRCWRGLTGRSFQAQVTDGLVAAFSRVDPDVVLAEYGPTGVNVYEACERLGIPLVVHFHGFDASQRSLLATHGAEYRRLFERAAGIVAVSLPMRRKLIELGAAEEKVFHNPYGVDCAAFEGADPASAPPVLLAVGRFVDKKAPESTLRAFAAVHHRYPEARLRMIGDGPLLASCQRRVEEWGLRGAVEFLGPQPADVVRREMQAARAFVQHSVVAASGDSEGLPVAILEAGATGLPVVSTRHAGIPEAVLHETTGLLVDEGDVEAMADAMERIVRDASLAAKLGRAARRRISTSFHIDRSIANLWEIIRSCARLPAAELSA